MADKPTWNEVSYNAPAYFDASKYVNPNLDFSKLWKKDESKDKNNYLTLIGLTPMVFYFIWSVYHNGLH